MHAKTFSYEADQDLQVTSNKFSEKPTGMEDTRKISVNKLTKEIGYLYSRNKITVKILGEVGIGGLSK